jgi:hypothetical protein
VVLQRIPVGIDRAQRTHDDQCERGEGNDVDRDIDGTLVRSQFAIARGRERLQYSGARFAIAAQARRAEDVAPRRSRMSIIC